MADDRLEERPQVTPQELPQELPGEKSQEASQEDIAAALQDLQDFGRARRTPPTIDLEASEVSRDTRDAAGDAAPESASHAPQPEETRSDETVAAESAATEPPHPASAAISAPISPWVIAPVSGAVAAALVIGVGWVLGWPAVQPAAPVAPQVSVAAVDGIAARVAGLEAKIGKPVADPATVARIVTLEKSQASLRDELAATRAQSEKLIASSSLANSGAVNSSAANAAPVDPAAAVDLSAINARLDQIEGAVHAATAPQNARPADDAALRRVVVASLLDLSVRQGEPFKDALGAAKALAPDDAALNSLESFASTGVPTAAILSRELLTLVPKLSPPPVLGNDTVSPDIVDRLRSGAAKLIRIERTDAVGNDRGAIVARVTAAALRNDSNDARRELKTLPPEERTAAQSWLDKADARDAALAASRQFATDAMAALAKPAQ
jgi:hypothetical protein